MDFGDVLIRLAFIGALLSGALAVPGLFRRPTPGALPWLFGMQALALGLAFGLLATHFAAHRFEYVYVAQYSSRVLSPALTLAAVWAGQAGSLLLWAALGALVGVAMLGQPGPLARPAIAFVSLSQLFFLVLLLIKSPFERSAVAPPDGMGLNPLLEDPWMVVHPPVLFVGYAAMVAPFALAAASLVRREESEFHRPAWPWALFAVVSLGLGIGLGGVWAYKTLGWGGYWGWDPVENASLIPWLVAVALIHGLLITRTTKALARTNLILALLGYLTVIGGTYLTRSGVLADFSVHSFANEGLNTPLLAFLGSFAALGAGLMAWRWRALAAGAANWASLSRESALWLGLMTVMALAVLVALGTTAPILTALSGRPSNVSIEYYKLISVPLGVALVLLMAVAPALRWTRQQGLHWLTALAPGLAFGLAGAGIAFAAGIRDAAALALVALSGAALGVNAAVTVRLFRRGWSYGAGYLGHVGVAVMVLGMVISGTLGRSERVRLVAGEKVERLGYTLEFSGASAGPRGERIMEIEVSRPGYRYQARPTLVAAPRMEGMMRKPAIDGWNDLYLSPVELESGHVHDDGHDHGSAEPVWVERGQVARIGGAEIAFAGFRMASHERMEVYADLEVRTDGRIASAAPGLRAGANGMEPIAAEVPGFGTVTIAGIDADHGRVALVLPQGVAAAGAVALVEISTRPLVNLVWIGALLALIGSALAGVRRAGDRIAARAAAHPKVRGDGTGAGTTPAPARGAGGR
jgi:cytochrome c-type biogenesis protein CcmF